MVFAAPQQIMLEQPPMSQLAVRTSPSNLFQGGQIISEGPVPREELIRQGRLFEGEPEKPLVIIPGQMIDIQQLILQQPQLVQQVVGEQVLPMTYAQVPAVTVMGERLQCAALQPTTSLVQEPLAFNGPGPQVWGPQVQYAAQPAGSVMVEEVLTAQPLMQQQVLYTQEQPGSAVVMEYAQPEMTKTGTMVMMPPDQAHMVSTRPSASLAGRKGTITNALFDLLDSNADGKISKSEFRRGLKGEIIQVGQVANLPVRR